MKEPPEHIAKDIDDYVVKLKKQYKLAENNLMRESNISDSQKKARQIYYIPGNATPAVIEKKVTKKRQKHRKQSRIKMIRKVKTG